MNQLFIVKAAAALNGGAAAPTDISSMAAGALGVYALNDPSKWVAAKPTSDFAIVLGNAANCKPLMVPEVNVSTLTVNIADPQAGAKFKGEITIPSVTAGKDYCLIIVKKGKTFNERINYSELYRAVDGDTASTVAAALGAGLQAKADAGTLNISVTVAAAKITVNGVYTGEQFNIVPSEALIGTAVTITEAQPATGDAEFVKDLARRCAANKGFNENYRDGDSIYPGFPEVVEDVTYCILTLRFATTRSYGKQTDTKVYQNVYIAVPTTSAALPNIKHILADVALPVG